MQQTPTLGKHQKEGQGVEGMGSSQRQHQPASLCLGFGDLVSSYPISGTSIQWKSSTAKMPTLGASSRQSSNSRCWRPVTEHSALCQHLRWAAANISLHTILLGVGGTISQPFQDRASWSGSSESYQACCEAACTFNL